jgi:CRISPR-associated protein (TIGR03986 family)
MSERIVEVTNLPHGTDLARFQAILKKYGLAAYAATVELEGRTGRFRCPEAQSQQARNALHGKKLPGGRALKAEVVAPRPATPVAPPPPPVAWGADRRSRPPYHFVPVDGGAAVTDPPEYHDKIDLDNLWSGELHCTLTALTPLLAANDQYDFGKAVPAVRAALEDLVRSKLRKGPADPVTIEAAKKVLEPLALRGADESVPGAVLIGGAALKGMVRQSFGALLSAPMERVQERHFSYRPNAYLNPDTDDHLTSCAGVISRRVTGGVEVIPLAGLTEVLYVKEPADAQVFRAWGTTEAAELLRASGNPFPPAGPSPLFQSEVTVRDCDLDFHHGRKRPRSRNGQSVKLRNVYLLPYRPGLDGRGVFNQAFHDNNHRRGYRWVVLRWNNTRPPLAIPQAVVDGWRRTVEHLRDDRQGHLLRHPNIGARQGAAVDGLTNLLREGFRPGDVVFFEQEKDAPNRVLTMGHHFRYRWRYRDTIRTTTGLGKAAHAGPVAPDLRDLLCPRPVEWNTNQEGRPEGLSAARLLFGFVGTPDGMYSDCEPLTCGIGGVRGPGQRNDFAMLTGRIAINVAVEQDAARDAGDRFLNADRACLVPLRALGSPKASAVEHYLTQDGIGGRPDAGILCTYGDHDHDNAVGELRGRKFYLHQPKAAEDKTRYDLLAGGNDQVEDPDVLLSDQAVVGRFVSQPRTQFRFTLRFVNLRPWELGALLFTLAPTRADVEFLCQTLQEAGAPLGGWLKRIPVADDLLAHKLGHGRPLGLGSVRIDVDALVRLRAGGDWVVRTDPQGDDARRALLKEFATRMQGLGANLAPWVQRVLIPWLEVHRYAGRHNVDYPRHAQQRTIFNHHSALRTDHAKGRKRRAPNARERHGLADPG